MQNWRLATLGAVLIVSIICSTPALSQTAQTNSAANAQAISELATKLNDDQSAALVRMLEVLAQENEAVAASVADRPGLMQVLRTSLAAFGERIKTNVVSFPAMIGGTFSAIAKIFDSRGAPGSLVLLALIAVLILSLIHI